MGKAAMCIRMLQILNTGRLYKVKELASLLETNPRNIIEYKKELDSISSEAGFYIETVPGRYGGYRLNGNASLPSSNLSEEAKRVLLKGYDYLLSKKDFLEKKELQFAYSALMSNVENDKKESEKLMVVEKYQISMSDESLKERYDLVEKAIKEKRQLEVIYDSLKKGPAPHILDPYRLYILNNAWFFLAYDHEGGDIWQFKLNRVKEISLTDRRFVVWSQFNERDYFDENGFLKKGEYHHCHFLVTGLRAMLFKERVYGKNQRLRENEDGSLEVEVDLQNEEVIVSLVLQSGEEMKVIEPSWLIEKVKEKAKAIIEKYE